MGSEKVKNDSPVSYKGQLGGARPGAGRPKGSENAATKKRRLAEQEYRARVIRHVPELFNAQLNLAKGVTYLIRIDEVKNSKGQIVKKHRIVESPTEMIEVLDELQDSERGVVDDHYYYISHKPPSSAAIDSMMDRVFGKAPLSITADIESHLLEKEYDELTDEELAELIADAESGEGEEDIGEETVE